MLEMSDEVLMLSFYTHIYIYAYICFNLQAFLVPLVIL
jgi:hypothetical protein